MADNGYTWQVTGQMNDSQIDANGQVVQGKTVSFVISPSQQTGHVFIPDVTYANTEAAREAIQAEVDAMVAVGNLNG